MLTTAVILAAGAGSRFGGPTHKLCVEIDGRRIVDRAVDSAVASGIGPVVVVAGAVDLAIDRDGVTVVDNPDWAAGQITSLRAAVDDARHRGADALVVALGDQPFLDPAAWRLVAASDAPIAVATYDGRRGHPVRLAAEVWDRLPHEGDEGARSLLGMFPDLVAEVPCPGSPVDIDTPEDLRDG